MELQRYCEIQEINWMTIPELQNRLEKLGIRVKRVSHEVTRFPDTYSFSDDEELLKYVKTNGIPPFYTLHFYTEREAETGSITITRSKSIHGSEFLSIRISDLLDQDGMESIFDFFSLKPESVIEKEEKLKRNAFIAYRFDEIGENLSLKLSRFLELLGFSVKTGRGFSPKKVSEKVEERIASQSILFVLLTKGSDNTWLTQEPMFAKANDKPVFLLKEHDFVFTPGIFADHEFIPFEVEHFEKSFIKILEGLKELDLIC